MDAIQAYRESELAEDKPVRLVVLLYDQLLRDLYRALDAFEKQDIPRRCDELDHALVVLAQLQGTLDLESGGEVAENLDRFYHLIREDLVRAGLDESPHLLHKQWQQILAVRSAWLEVEQQQTSPSPKSVAPLAPHSPDRDNAKGTPKWQA